jgi:aminoglycoside 6-adenylyltransferase
MDQLRVLDDVVKWASDDENIRLVVVTGSVARGDAMVDELSDLDVEVYVLDPILLIEQRDWYQRFGVVLVVEDLEDPDWHPTRLVYYVDGKIDFMIGAVEAARRGVDYDRPYNVLVDKDDLAEHLSLTSEPQPPPTADELHTCVNWFYAAGLMCAKCIVRDEPWMAKFRDWDLKTELLKMVVWDHKARYGWNYDTWHNGGHMHDWMDADIIEALTSCWAGFSPDDIQRGLAASVALFDELSARTATTLGLEPFDSTAVRKEIDRILTLG